MSDKASSLAGAKEEGLQQGIYLVAENMVKNNIDIKIIRTVTNLSLEEIERIKINLENKNF